MACNLSESKQLGSMAEMQQLNDNLLSLKIAEEAQTASPSSCLTDSPDHWDYNAEGDGAQSQWREFNSFMDKKARTRPYPKYLYRAHVHGHPFPRLPDVFEGEYSDSFGSDLHLWCEDDAQTQMFMPIGDLMDNYTVEDLFWHLNLHLGKTCINLQPNSHGEQPFLSPLVSLSGDFRWTAQRICRVGRMISKDRDQMPGLAIFKTSNINPSGVRVYRVEDMLSFLNTRLAESSVHISSQRQGWAKNADEYVCWSLVPRDALAAFTPLAELIETSNGGDEAFLTKGFVDSNYLGDFRQLSRVHPVHISVEEYAERASRFMHNIIANVSSLEEAKQLCMDMERVLLNPDIWGYGVAKSVQGLDETISSSLEKVLETAFMVK
ncbi:uncharacterized protein TrAtP1_001541 [Trichoderma atroviride]|uniref:Uncharacterized protein n=1 Tax=Hypocrea atroviridis (strain ATCC 20476 / IMI 206040) TaxID=452589 RepID=G9P102_HYPAI|nr:uncharacterized protein TRIATDRAFT_33117 [Trichoderma atroviride IMI 206040]EHK43249.1 hypothetical protein TRIATDRAFT_33117 [Trichoderma atroviride IMI 206040]UKZ60259.1 hypothetical protein TrAtP1_001541 [Trichoderma atroviride]